MYIEIIFRNLNPVTSEILIANLQETASGFEETEAALTAIFPIEKYNEEEIVELASTYNLHFEKKEIVPQNWNAVWESNFSPVVVDDFVGIRAEFHNPMTDVAHEIIITPKMSFGTGHHATTFLVMRQMQKISFVQKTVFDFGTGTGVLAILSKKLGASVVVANDIDDWSIENAKENFERNAVLDINLLKNDSAKLNGSFDIILANINRNVLMDNIPTLAEQLNNNGQLILSGILETDVKMINEQCANSQLKLIEKTEKNNWICLRFIKA